jgi:hypothetical protein
MGLKKYVRGQHWDVIKADVRLGINPTHTHVDKSNQSFTCPEHNMYDKKLIYRTERETVCVLENYFNWKQHDLRSREALLWCT